MDGLNDFVIIFYNNEDRITFFSNEDEGEPEIYCNGEWIDKGNKETYDYIKNKYGETRAKEIFDEYKRLSRKRLENMR